MSDVKHEVHTFRLIFELLAEKILMALMNLTVCCFHVTYASMNLHSKAARMSRNSLLKTGAISEVQVTGTGCEPTNEILS